MTETDVANSLELHAIFQIATFHHCMLQIPPSSNDTNIKPLSRNLAGAYLNGSIPTEIGELSLLQTL